MSSTKPHLWIVSELFPPDETSTAYIMGEIAKSLTAKYDVSVICGPEIYDTSKRISDTVQPDSTISLTRVKGVRENKSNKFSRIRKFLLVSWRIYRVAKRNIKKGETVLMVSNPFPLILLMSRLKKQRNFGLNMLVHDVFPESLFTDLKLPAFFYRLLSKKFNRAYAETDQLIVLGRDMKEVMSHKTKGRSKITVIENWADTININPKMQSADSNDDNLVIQYAGNVGTAQGVAMMIDVVKAVANPQLIFEIWGNGSDINNVRNKILSYDLSENILLKGTYLRSEQDSIISNCDIAIVTLVEGMYGLGTPSKSYNILAAGKPILYIGEKNTEIWLMVEENNIGFCFQPSDTIGIINCLKTLDKEKLSLMGKRARALAEQSYSKEIILKKFQETI